MSLPVRKLPTLKFVRAKLEFEDDQTGDKVICEYDRPEWKFSGAPIFPKIMKLCLDIYATTHDW